MYYVSDALYALSLAVTIFFLRDISVGKSQSYAMLMRSGKTMMNPVVLNFFGMCLCLGITQGVSANFIPVHLKDDLHATSQMIGMYVITVHFSYFRTHQTLDS